MSPSTDRAASRSRGRALLAWLTLSFVACFVVGALSLASSGCEVVVGTSDLVDGLPDATTAFDGSPGDDDDDDASFDATMADGSPDGTTDAQPPGDASPSDGGDANPSCAYSTARHTCGITQKDDCCAVDPVNPAGSYKRTYDAGSVGTNATDLAVISPFALDRYEVTVGRFREYVNYLADGGEPPQAGSGIHTYLNTLEGPGLLIDPVESFYEQGWSALDNSTIPLGTNAIAEWPSSDCTGGTYTSAPGDAENLPMTCITWYEAYAFCIWDGGYLPSEAEWEFAAAAGGQEREYPWGSTDPGTQRQYANFACSPPECPAIVGNASLGVGAYGHFDLMGNVAEWTADDHVPYNDPTNEATTCNDCLNYDVSGESSETEMKVARGGAYPYKAGDQALFPPTRSEFPVGGRDYYLGVRCGRNP